MDLQSTIAIVVVLLCGLFAARSWYVYWKGLVHSVDTPSGTGTTCSGCSSGCKMTTDSPPIVELKREARCIKMD